MTDNDIINEQLKQIESLQDEIAYLRGIIEELESMERLRIEKNSRKKH